MRGRRPRTGRLVDVCSPSPSCASAPAPQQYAVPTVVTPHVKSLPALITAKESPPSTRTGLLLQGVPASEHAAVTAGLPSCPSLLRPQQYATCWAVIPHAWLVPALMDWKTSGVD